jgi:hypothetical protein
MSEQQSLFGGSPHKKNRARMSAQAAFDDFHKTNPRVYRALVKYAREMYARGFRRYSMKTIWAVLRWHSDLSKDAGETYKLNDRYYSRYARLIMENEPDLRDFFDLRKLRS